MKGVTLLETIIVVATIALLSFIGTNSIINFKNEAELEKETSELISDIKFARNKSMNGELPNEEDPNEFAKLPEYGISISENNYKIIKKYSKIIADTPVESKEEIESFNINSNYSLWPPGTEFFFERITGNTQDVVLTMTDKNGEGREISITDGFMIDIRKI